MATFPGANDPHWAGLALATAFEHFGDVELDEQSLSNEEMQHIVGVARVASIACGKGDLGHHEVSAQLNAYQAWFDTANGQDVMNTFLAAGETLGKHWQDGSMKAPFLRAVLQLAFGDEKFTENEGKMITLVATMIGATQELQQVIAEMSS